MPRAWKRCLLVVASHLPCSDWTQNSELQTQIAVSVIAPQVLVRETLVLSHDKARGNYFVPVVFKVVSHWFYCSSFPLVHREASLAATFTVTNQLLEMNLQVVELGKKAAVQQTGRDHTETNTCACFLSNIYQTAKFQLFSG